MAVTDDRSGRDELRLELRWVDGGYEATAHWPDGATDVVAPRRVVERSRVDEVLAKLGRGKGKAIGRDVEGASSDPARELGEHLMLTLVEGELGARYHQAVARATSSARQLRLCLAMSDRRLAELPWELLYDRKRQDFVALSVRTPLVRRWSIEGEGGAGAEPLPPLEGPLRLMVVDAGGPVTRPEAAALRKAEGEGLRLTVVEAPSKARLLEAIAKSAEPLLHVVGPPRDGAVAAGGPWLGGFGDETGAGGVSPGDVLAALGERRRAGLPPLRFAFWGAGQSEAFAREVAPGVAASAGVRDALTAAGAHAFVASLYRELAEGQSLDAAFTEARQRVDREAPGNRQWALPALYLQRGSALGAHPRRPARGLTTGLEAQNRPVRLAQARLEMHRRNVEALRQALGRAEPTARPPHLVEQLGEAERRAAEAERRAREAEGQLADGAGARAAAAGGRPRHSLPGEEQFRRLLRASLLLRGQHEQLGRLSADGETLRRGGLVVAAGELAALRALGERYEQSCKALQAMDSSKSDAGPHLAALERELDAVEWELAAEVRESLARKSALHARLVDGYERGLEGARAALGEFDRALAEAARVSAPLEQESRRRRELDGLMRGAERALRDAQFEAAFEPLAALRAYVDREHARALATVRDKAEAAGKICRQADLLFLRSPLDARRRYRYTVLLRTPSEPGAQGVNIQASTTLVERDRLDILDDVRAFTGHLGGEVERRRAARDVTPPPRSTLGDGREPGEVVRDVGELMYRLFMPEEMQRYVDETPCSLTVTTNDLELPWELMFPRGGRRGGGAGADGDDFLCVRRPVARLPMGHAFPRHDRGVPARRERLRFLLVHSNPRGDLPEVEREVAAVRDALVEGWGERIEVETLGAGEVTGRRFNRILREGTFDVIHYAGHASADDEQGDLSGLLLGGGEVFFAQKVRRLLEGRPLVFLNACQSGAVAGPPAESRPGAYAQAEGLASAFIYGGAVACIGSLWPIYDVPAAAFATAFYRYVLEGNMIGEAMRLARRDVRREHPGDATWAAFVLYGNPTYRHTLG